ncbi:alkaline phosphatase family protein [Nocardioides sp. WS12]|uniref:alkaline phosphatase family protein n=1 Tax=Nocardioides sp. WS12 TaxID=2486272 RepID=UPI0015F8C00A|nr:alkaline phosphatase family protein [Nocardioides sp. WS12]
MAAPTSSSGSTSSPATTEPTPSSVEPTDRAHVVAISVDGLAVEALLELGAKETPNLHRLLDEGASTLNARTAYEKNVTLPNHVGMVTGRRIDAVAGGHGVTWNGNPIDDTVQAAAGEKVASIFSVAHRHHLTTALFAGKTKFDIMRDSWPRSIDDFEVRKPQARLVADALAHLVSAQPNLTFLHLAGPDAAGHRDGGMSPAYLDAVRVVDRLVGLVIAAIESTPALDDTTTVILTADHGFAAGTRDHGALVAENYTIPFLVWGPDVAAGDLYESNPDRHDPGTGRPSYDGAQPIRNLDLADAAMRVLGLPAVPPDEGPPDLRW